MNDYALRRGLQLEDIDGELLVLDHERSGVFTIQGAEADALRWVAEPDGPAPSSEVLDALVEAGLIVGGLDRRTMLKAGAAAAALLGAAAFVALPSAAAAASGGSGGPGGPGGPGGETAPMAPTITSGSGGPGSEDATITFDVGADGGSPITNHEYSLDGGTTWTPFSPAVTSGPVTITGLTGPTTIALRAVNAVGESGPSNTVTVTPGVVATVPEAPVLVTITPDTLSAIVSFTPGGDGGSAITNYQYTIDGGTTWTPVSPADTSSPVTVSPLLATLTTIALRAVNAVGEGPTSNSLTVTPDPMGVPGAPDIATAWNNGVDAGLTFTLASDGGSPVTNFEYSKNGGTTWTPFSPPVLSGPATVPAIAAGNSIRLRAVNVVGAGAASNAATVATQTQSFTATGSTQDFVVPAGVEGLVVSLAGGTGGRGGDDNTAILNSNDHDGGPGGQAGRVDGRLLTFVGETLTVAPGVGGGTGINANTGTGGGQGTNGLGAFAGGVGGQGTSAGGGGGGGAATVVRRGAIDLAVAAGGGGGGGAQDTHDNGQAGQGQQIRPDVTSSDGRPGGTSSFGGTGGGGGGGGGAQGGDRGPGRGGDSLRGLGGFRGTNLVTGLATVTTNGATTGLGSSVAGTAAFTWLEITVA